MFSETHPNANKPVTLWPAPAKINHFLHVIGRREDGYHELQTAFQFLTLEDTLVFKPLEKEGCILTTNHPALTTENNLITKAFDALKRHVGYPLPGFEIQLIKNIPLGSGLGGGSSNAATTLQALNMLWDLRLSQTALKEIGVKLGADVPIFIHGQAAFAEGIGEKLTPLPLPESHVLLLVPNCHVSTPRIFTDPQLPRNTPKITVSEFLKKGGHNDCLKVTCKMHKEVDKAYHWLAQYTDAKMTGTGAVVFATFDDQAQLWDIKQKASAETGFTTHVAKSRNRSSLYLKLNECQDKSHNEIYS